MKLGLIIEGEDDKSVISKLVSKICEQADHPVDISKERIKVSRGFGNINTNLISYANLLVNAEAEMIVVVVDNDRNLPGSRLKSLTDKISQVSIPVVVGVAVQSIEMWLLADEGALNSRLGTTQISRPKSKINYPKDELARIVKQHSDQPVSGSLCGEIAGKSDKRILDNRCKSFKNFHNELKNCLRRAHQPIDLG